MNCSTHIKIKFLVLFFPLLTSFVRAQSSLDESKFSVTEYRNFDDYYERVTYVGKRKDYFIVDTYLKDSTLYRTDNYRYIDQGIHVGFFAVRHGSSKIFYHDGRLYLTCDYNMNVLNGPFMVYYNDGSIRRRELYRNGRLKKGVCYDADGREQTCGAFYQKVKFMAKPQALKEYLETNLQPILAGHQALIVTMTLIVNEIGQIINVKMDADRNNTKLIATVRKLMQDMPRWRENESNWKPASMDGVPVPGSWEIQAYRDRGYWHIIFPQQE